MKAKRGDLVVIERKTSYVTTSEGWHEAIEYEVGVVSNITREGAVKAFVARSSEAPRKLDLVVGFIRCYVMPQTEIDVNGACEAAWANEWRPGYPGKPFDSLISLKDCVRPFRVDVSHA